MATTIAEPRTLLEDPQAHLPRSVTHEYQNGQVIYGNHEHSAGIYLVMAGKVKVSRVAENGRRVVLDIYLTDEFFGESALLNSATRDEEAMAIEKTTVMTWKTSAIEGLVGLRPQLGIALLQLLARRTIDLGDRIESFSTDNTVRRLARLLVYLCERLGRVTADGSIQIMPLTQELLSQYIGTSREIVTHGMNQLRERHFVRYSRSDGILVYREAMQEWLCRSRSTPATLR